MLTPKEIQILNMILYFQIRCKLNILQNLLICFHVGNLSELIFVICISNMNYCSALLKKSCEIYLCIMIYDLIYDLIFHFDAALCITRSYLRANAALVLT